MYLPNSDRAHIPKDKLNNYLLSETHAVGRAKARYFRSIGYSAENANDLADALLTIARSESVIEEIFSDFGTKYIVDGKLASPIGIVVQLRTVWVIESDDDSPRFVTAYPS